MSEFLGDLGYIVLEFKQINFAYVAVWKFCNQSSSFFPYNFNEILLELSQNTFSYKVKYENIPQIFLYFLGDHSRI